MAYVRKQFGKVSCCRVFESFENGHPHIHCILLFENHEFSVFRDSKGQFRIHEKDILAEGWHSNIDVKAMGSLAGGFSYVKKYLLKSIDFDKADSIADSKALKTLALCWAYRKRAFSVSGEFRQMLSALIEALNSSKRELCQVTLSGEIIEENKFYVLGFVSGEALGFRKEVWFMKLTNEQIDSVEEFLSIRCTKIARDVNYK